MIENNSIFRYAIWAAVSTEVQASDDKFSLDVQVEHCRDLARKRGWIETGNPYIVPGESRTRWVNLSDAETAIPQLKELLDDAQMGKFDIILVHEYDRLRELLDPVARTLSYYGVQLVSVSQFLEPLDPKLYNPYASDSESILRGMSTIFSRAAVANLRRKYLANMPLRITERGLPQVIPWGYRRIEGHETDRNAVPVQIPETIGHLIMMRNLLLSGRSMYQIAAELDNLSVPMPKAKNGGKKWDPTTVRRILTNPFYAGYVRWGATKSQLDPRSGKITRTPKPKNQVITAVGRHQPVWDDSVMAAIETEIERRAPSHRGHITRQLTGLLRCSICGAGLWRHTSGSHVDKSKQIITWRCSEGFAGHVVVPDSVMLEKVATELVHQLDEQKAEVPAQVHDEKLKKLRQKRTRIGDAYTNELFDLAEFSRRVSGVDQQIEKLEKLKKAANLQLAGATVRSKTVAMLRSILQQVNLLDYLRDGDYQEINTALHFVVSEIIVDSDGNIVKVVPNNS